MIRTFRYRILPTRTQEAALFLMLKLTREIYNAALEERKGAWQKQKISISRIDQEKQIAVIREDHPELLVVPIAILRGALRRLDKAFSAFFRRCKKGEKPGFPRFKGKARWHSILIDDLPETRAGKSPIVAGGKRLHVPLVGKIKLKMHRPIEGKPKAMRLTVDAGGRWFVSIACVDVPAKPLPKTGRDVGIDLGLIHFLATSDHKLYENPRPIKQARLKLERSARRLSRRKKGSKRRNKARVLLAKDYAHVANVRRENHIQVAREMVANYDIIFIEDLNIKGLARGMLAKSVNDAAWGNFQGWLRTKAESAGREVVEVNPRGSSHTCSSCHCAGPPLPLKVRIFRCAKCELEIDRDDNAARHIKWLGLSQRGAALLVEGQL